MREDFLHYLWAFQKINHKNLKTTAGESLSIINQGKKTSSSGPDFSFAQLKIDHWLWIGSVEIHLKSSDWYIHHHESDYNYKNVVLHVVWEHDMEVYDYENNPLPTLELKEVTPKNILKNYDVLMDETSSKILCKNRIKSVDKVITDIWTKNLFLERLEAKAMDFYQILRGSHYDWEEVFYFMLAKSFGLNINGNAFLRMAQQTPFGVLKKCQSILQTEAVLFGQAGMLENNCHNNYFEELKSEYQYLKAKFSLSRHGAAIVKFSQLRPANFPTIRLSQLANVLYMQRSLFSKIIHFSSLKDLYDVFICNTSKFWETHYTFDKQSRRSIKKLTTKFIDLLIINTILPMKYLYQHVNKIDDNKAIMGIATDMLKETNSITTLFERNGVKVTNIVQSQAYLQLYNHYCSNKKCLECDIGNALLYKNNVDCC